MLTVVIPSYNHATFIEECLTETLKISVDKKILVVDDGSTDGSIDIIESIINTNKNANITLVRKPNSGLVSSLSLALNAVDTEYIYFVASDDVPIAAGIFDLYKRMEENKILAFCIGGGVNFFPDGSTSPVYGERHKLFFNLEQELFRKQVFLNYPNPILLQSSIFRTEVLNKIGGWDTSLVLDDFPTFIKLFRSYGAKEFLFLPEIMVVKYRHHGSNSYRRLLRQYQIVCQTLRKLAPLELRFRAIGYEWAYFFLQSLYQRRFLLSLDLLREISPVAFFWALLRIPELVFRKLKD